MLNGPLFDYRGAARGGSKASSLHPPLSALGNAEVVVVEFLPPTFLAAIKVERLDRFTKVGQLAEEKVPTRIRPADPDGKLAAAAESRGLRFICGSHLN
jgi:hypothetical protein